MVEGLVRSTLEASKLTDGNREQQLEYQPGAALIPAGNAT